MKKSEINEKVFSAHSYKSVSTSAAFVKGVQLRDILETANWSNAKTFYTFYKRELNNDYSDTILRLSRRWICYRNVFFARSINWFPLFGGLDLCIHVLIFSEKVIQVYRLYVNKWLRNVVTDYKISLWFIKIQFSFLCCWVILF